MGKREREGKKTRIQKEDRKNSPRFFFILVHLDGENSLEKHKKSITLTISLV